LNDFLNGTSGPEIPKKNIVRHMSAPFFPPVERVEQRAKKTGKLSPSLRYPMFLPVRPSFHKAAVKTSMRGKDRAAWPAMFFSFSEKVV
jgi:hypothetical protein